MKKFDSFTRYSGSNLAHIRVTSMTTNIMLKLWSYMMMNGMLILKEMEPPKCWPLSRVLI